MEADSPNYFTSAFLSHDFSESITREIHTDRHPQLFALIVEHLSGYTILPLEERGLPRCMSEEAAVENLLKDAKYFGLERLQTILSSLETPFPLPKPVFSLLGTKSEIIYPLERVCKGGDLAFDTKVYVSTPSSEPLPLSNKPPDALFLVKDVELSFVLLGDSHYDGPDTLQLLIHESILPLTYRELRTNNDRTLRLKWSEMDTDNAINQRRTTFKLNKEFVDLDLLDRSIVKEDSDWPWEARIQCRSLECPLRRDNEDALPTLDVVAEALVILISTDTEEDGYHVRARARLVYAEFKTKDEWTRTRVAPAAAAFSKR